MSAADTEGLARYAYCGEGLVLSCSQRVSVSHDPYSKSSSTEVIAAKSISINEVCVIEIEDAEYNEISEFDIKVDKTSSDFDVSVYVSRGNHPSEYVSLTALDEDNVASVTVDAGEGERLFMVVYPRTYSGGFQAEITHRGEAAHTGSLT